MHLEALQGPFSPETNVYLGYTCYFGGHIEFGIKITPHQNFRNGYIALKIVGLEVLHKFLFYNGHNLEIPQIQDGRQTLSWIPKTYPENDRESSVLDSKFKQLYWKISFLQFYPFQAHFYKMLPG